jgi:sugar lactone lactonase YvrE
MLTSSSELAEIAQLVRFPSPAPTPQSLAHDGEHLWLGSWETERVYGLDPKQGRVFEEVTAPGRPIGSTVVGDELRFVCSENGEGDNRFIRRFVPGHGFKTHESIPCPDDTGSFLAFDGERLWLSQRMLGRVLELDSRNRVVRTIEIGSQILGICWAGTRLYLSLWLGKERGGARLAYIAPKDAVTVPVHLAASPFAMISLAADGERFWTNDSRATQIVAFALPV